jgi:hypothetical protein
VAPSRSAAVAPNHSAVVAPRRRLAGRSTRRAMEACGWGRAGLSRSPRDDGRPTRAPRIRGAESLPLASQAPEARPLPVRRGFLAGIPPRGPGPAWRGAGLLPARAGAPAAGAHYGSVRAPWMWEAGRGAPAAPPGARRGAQARSKTGQPVLAFGPEPHPRPAPHPVLGNAAALACGACAGRCGPVRPAEAPQRGRHSGAVGSGAPARTRGDVGRSRRTARRERERETRRSAPHRGCGHGPRAGFWLAEGRGGRSVGAEQKTKKRVDLRG